MEVNKFGKAVGILFVAISVAVDADVLASRQFSSSNIYALSNSNKHLALRDDFYQKQVRPNLGLSKELKEINTQFSPSISPDGKKIIFLNHEESNSYLSLVDIDGRNLTNIIPYDDHVFQDPIWLDNKTVAFLDTAAWLDKRNISIINIDGSNRHKLDFTVNNFDDISTFCFDKNTKRIVFAGSKLDTYEIYLINIDGRNPNKLITIYNANGSLVYDMKCSPSGQITYTYHSPNRNHWPHEYTLNPQTGDLHQNN